MTKEEGLAWAFQKPPGLAAKLVERAAPHLPPVHIAQLPTDATSRKAIPIATGVLGYFPDAIAAVAEVSRIGNDQHNPGKPLHWRRGASTDHADCAIRHFMERGTRDSDGGRHTAKAVWRVLALLQMEIEAERAGMSYADYIVKVQKEES